MTTDPITVSPDDDLAEAVELLIEQKIGGIPVVDEAEGLVEIVNVCGCAALLSQSATGTLKIGEELQ